MEGCSFTVGADRSDLPEVVQPNIAINTSGGMPTAKAEEETPDALQQSTIETSQDALYSTIRQPTLIVLNEIRYIIVDYRYKW